MKKSDLVLAGSRLLLDGLMIWGGLMLAFYIRMVYFRSFGLNAPTTVISVSYFQTMAYAITAFLVGVLALHGRYRLRKDESFLREIQDLFWAFSAGYALLVVGFFFGQFIFFSRFILGLGWLLGLVLLFLGRSGVQAAKYRAFQQNIGRTRLLILGTNDLAKGLLHQLKIDPHYRVVGILSEKRTTKKTFEEYSILGDFEGFEKILEKHSVDEVLLAGDLFAHPENQKIVQQCHIKGLKFQFVPDQIDVELSTVQVSMLENQPVITILNTRMIGWGLVCKMIADYILAGIGIVLISPVLLWIACRIRRDDPGAPIFYAADRVGKNGQIFKCYKFRTMVVDAEKKQKELQKHNQRKGGIFFKMKDDPRVTPFGAFLRRTSLDELPQLWNVLRGEMSLIGPRPHLPGEVEQYKNEDRRLIGVRPGMTGFAQVNGLANLSFEEEIRFELLYLKNWSIWLDAWILIKTIFIVFQKKNELD